MNAPNGSLGMTVGKDGVVRIEEGGFVIHTFPDIIVAKASIQVAADDYDFEVEELEDQGLDARGAKAYRNAYRRFSLTLYRLQLKAHRLSRGY